MPDKHVLVPTDGKCYWMVSGRLPTCGHKVLVQGSVDQLPLVADYVIQRDSSVATGGHMPTLPPAVLDHANRTDPISFLRNGGREMEDGLGNKPA